MYKREKATTVTVECTVHQNIRQWIRIWQRERGGRVFTQNAFVNNNIHYQQWRLESIERPSLPLCTGFYGTIEISHLKSQLIKAQCTDHIINLTIVSCFKGAVTASFSTLIRNRCLRWARRYSSRSNTDAFMPFETILRYEWIALHAHISLLTVVQGYFGSIATYKVSHWKELHVIFSKCQINFHFSTVQSCNVFDACMYLLYSKNLCISNYSTWKLYFIQWKFSLVVFSFI